MELGSLDKILISSPENACIIYSTEMIACILTIINQAFNYQYLSLIICQALVDRLISN